MARPGHDYLHGKLLIASPVIGDPRFDRAVVYLCAHGEDHAMGLIVNRPMKSLRLPDLFVQLEVKSEITVPDRPVLDGGPVDRDRGFVLHSADVWCDPATLGVSETVGLTATKDILEAMASANAPARSAMALGYAGWEAGQLEDEIAQNAWLVAEPDDELVFGDDHEAKWARALKNMGVAPEFLTGVSGHA